VANGGTVDFTLTGSPTTWGTGRRRPPSFSDGRNGFNNIGAPRRSATTANLDSSGHSYSTGLSAAASTRQHRHRERHELHLASRGGGKPDNWLVNGQVIDLGGRSPADLLPRLRQQRPVHRRRDRHLHRRQHLVGVDHHDGLGRRHTQSGNTVAGHAGHWNATDGSTLRTICSPTTPVALTVGKQVRSVTLPASTNQGPCICSPFRPPE